MATKAAAFQAWLSGFGVPAYAAEAVPEDARPPYFTYGFGAAATFEEYAAQVDLWHVQTAKANALCEKLGEVLGTGGEFVRCDGGALWLKQGSPFWQAVTTDEDCVRRYINIDIENLTS